MLLKDLKLVRKCLSLSLFERYRRVDLSIVGWPVSPLDDQLAGAKLALSEAVLLYALCALYPALSRSTSGQDYH